MLVQAQTAATATNTQTSSTNPASPVNPTEHHRHHHHEGDGNASGPTAVAGSSTSPAPTAGDDHAVSQVFAADIARAIQSYGGLSGSAATSALTP
jgi:hypothetical protein